MNFYFGPVSGYDDERREADYIPLHLRDERYTLNARAWAFMLAATRIRAFTRIVFEIELAFAQITAYYLARIKPIFEGLVETFEKVAATEEFAQFLMEEAKSKQRWRSVQYRHWKPRGGP